MALETFNIEDLKEGMVVGEDVKDKNGQLLLPAGLILVQKHLEVIKGWGISMISIESGEKETPLDPEVIARAERELEPHFQYANRKHLAMNELFIQCVTRLARQLSQRE